VSVKYSMSPFVSLKSFQNLIVSERVLSNRFMSSTVCRVQSKVLTVSPRSLFLLSRCDKVEGCLILYRSCQYAQTCEMHDYGIGKINQHTYWLILRSIALNKASHSIAARVILFDTAKRKYSRGFQIGRSASKPLSFRQEAIGSG
jgi:hypothetical protein